MKYSRGKWRLRKSWRGTVTSPAPIEVPGKGASLGIVYLTNPDTKRRTPEFAGNAALMLGAPEMYRILKKLVSSGGWMKVPLRRVSYLLEKIEEQAEELCPGK